MVIIEKTCETCGLAWSNINFLKDSKSGSPIYFASKKFNSSLESDVLFCSAEHSNDWHQKQIENKSKIQ